MWWPSAHPEFGGCSNKPDCSPDGRVSPSRKGSGFEQPPHAHQHWHIDVSYINVSGTFYYLCSILDGYSRSIVHWDLRESTTEAEIEVILQRAREKHPEAKPRIISRRTQVIKFIRVLQRYVFGPARWKRELQIMFGMWKR
jgi:hypothetical protein